MSLDAEEMIRIANEQAGVENPQPEVKVEDTTTTVQHSDPLQKKTPEEERVEALKLLEEQEKLNEEADNLKNFKEETPEEKVLRLEKELEELRNKEPEKKENPLEKVEKKVEEAGIDIAELTATYIEEGELSEKQIASLVKAGFDKDAIDAYIDTKQSIATKMADTMLDSIMDGGRATYDKMAEWMSENLSEAELKTYNKGVNSPEHSEIYIKAMYAKYNEAIGTNKVPEDTPRILRGNPDTRLRSDNDVFHNDREVAEAMADPRYKADPIYRHKVQQKLLRS